MSGTFTFVCFIVTIVLVFQLAQTYLKNRSKKPSPIDEELEDTLAKIGGILPYDA